MAKKILIGTVVISATRYYAGALLDVSAEADAIAAVVAAGGQLVDQGDPVIDAAALTAQQKLRDGQWQDVDRVMLTAVSKSAYAAAQGGGSGWQSPGIDVDPVAAGPGEVLDGIVVFEAGPVARAVATIWFVNQGSFPLLADDANFFAFEFTVYDAAGNNGDAETVATRTFTADPPGTGDWPIYGRASVSSALVVPAFGRLLVAGIAIGNGVAVPRTRVGVDLVPA